MRDGVFSKFVFLLNLAKSNDSWVLGSGKVSTVLTGECTDLVVDDLGGRESGVHLYTQLLGLELG